MHFPDDVWKNILDMVPSPANHTAAHHRKVSEYESRNPAVAAFKAEYFVIRNAYYGFGHGRDWGAECGWVVSLGPYHAPLQRFTGQVIASMMHTRGLTGDSQRWGDRSHHRVPPPSWAQIDEERKLGLKTLGWGRTDDPDDPFYGMYSYADWTRHIYDE